MDEGLPPQEVLGEIARLLEGLRGEAIIRLERPGAEYRWRIQGSVGSGKGGRLSEMERSILTAACEHPDERLTGDQLAKLAGYEISTRFRNALSHLRKLHLLSGQTGDAGYQATEAAFEHIPTEE